MADPLPVSAAPARGFSVATLTDPAGGNPLQRLRAFASQPAVRRGLPWFAALVLLGGAALAWAMLSTGPQRVLYAQLDDRERATVSEALTTAGIAYEIDNQTGALTVAEEDLYPARMVVASEGSVGVPEGGQELLASLPLGASRTLEGEQLRAARERELMLTIKEIDGVQAVRVHLAEAESSAFVSESFPPSASVMVRLARGRQLGQSQVAGIVNLVAGSVPGLSIDSVKVVDQHGRLLSERSSAETDRIALAGRIEEKLRGQLSQLLSPMIGEGNFTTQIQVDLDMDEVTSARETYDKEGALRSETQQQTQSVGAGPAVGVPGVLSNTPPPQTVPSPGPPGAPPVPPTADGAAAPAPPSTADTSAARTFELGREVSVANSRPGKVKRLSVAVALSSSALKAGRGGNAGEVEQIKQLVSAAVGADPARGDQVAVMVRKFDSPEIASVPFYETSWFASLVRNGLALVAVLLVLLLGVRPLIKMLRRPQGDEATGFVASDDGGVEPAGGNETRLLGEQVSLARRFVSDSPETATLALRRMLEAHKEESGR